MSHGRVHVSGACACVMSAVHDEAWHSSTGSSSDLESLTLTISVVQSQVLQQYKLLEVSV